MAIGERIGNLQLKDFDKIQNIVGQYSPVLNFRVPASEYFLFPNDIPLGLFFTTSDIIEHGGTGEEEFELDFPLVDSATLDDSQIAFSVEGNITAIDYAENKITIDHNVAESFKVYYIHGNGVFRVVYVPPIAMGSATKVLLERSALSIHAVNQNSVKSEIFLSRPGFVPEKHRLQVWYKGNTNIDFPPNGEIGEIFLPYKSQPREAIDPRMEQAIINSTTN